MSISHKRLGVFWGQTGISFVEVARNDFVQMVDVPFSDLQDAASLETSSLIRNPLLLDLVQRALRARGLATPDACLSLPARDMILRSFMVPWMRPHEIQGAVAFEARKYTPFPIEDLVYTYYPFNLVRDGVRNISVIFLGIRRDIYQGYVNFLLQCGLNVVYSEPSFMSLIRVLTARQMILPDCVTAILDLNKDTGEIFIASLGHVQFARDFRFLSPESSQTADGVDVARARLVNEIRMSLEFFSRQHNDQDVKKVVLLVPAGGEAPAIQWLKEDLSLAVEPLELPSIEKFVPAKLGHVNAYGAALCGSVPAVIDFNLSEGNVPAVMAGGGRHAVELRKDRVMMIVVLGFCLVMIGLVQFLFGQMTARKKAVLAGISSRLEGLASLPLDKIVEKKKNEEDNLRSMRSVEFHSTVTPVIVQLVKLIPRGIWLEDIAFSIKEDMTARSGVRSRRKRAEEAPVELKASPTLSISGFAFAGEDLNDALNLANAFMETLRSDSAYSSRFKDIGLLYLRTESWGEKKVAKFSIKCE